MWRGRLNVGSVDGKFCARLVMSRSGSDGPEGKRGGCLDMIETVAFDVEKGYVLTVLPIRVKAGRFP